MTSRPRIESATGLRRVNQECILKALRENGALSMPALGNLLNASVVTISRVTESLSRTGLVVASKPEGRRGVGRPPTLIDINADFAVILGIELGPRETRLVAADFKGRPIRTSVLSTGVLLPRFQSGLRRAVQDFRKGFSDRYGSTPLRGVAVGVSGVVTPDSGRILQGFLPVGLEICPLIEDALHVPVLADNDANLAAIAEHHFGAARRCAHATCMLDRGWPGVGMLINGRVLRGANNMAGELSSSIIRSHSDHRESIPIAESFGLERRIRERGYEKLVPETFASRSEMIATLRDFAEKGDSTALSLIHDEAEALAAALATLARLLDPEQMILAGDFTESGPTGERLLQEKFRGRMNDSPLYAETAPPVAFSRLGQDIVALGGIAAVIERITLETLHPET